jgi:hypothetical protein
MSIDWSKIWSEYRGLWVALRDDEQTVIASGKTAVEVWQAAREKGFTKPILARMPEKLLTYVGSV